MKTILITNHYPESVYKIFEENLPENFELKMLEENSQECLENNIKDADYIIASGRVKITKEVLENAQKLKMVQRTGVGLDSLNLEELRKRNIPLYVNQGINSESVAEHTILLILASLRRLTLIHENTSNGIWKKQEQGITTSELCGKTVGILGMGNIGKKVAKILNAFGANVIYNNLFQLSKEEEHELNMSFMNMQDVIKNADIITLHCPLTDDTKNIINEETIKTMKDGVVIVNTARGGLINISDLAKNLETGKIAFAGLDVYDEEPIKMENPILQQKNVIRTPHIAGVTKDSFEAMAKGALRNIEKFENDKKDEIEIYRIKE